ENPGASLPDPTHIADKVAYTGIAVYSPEILRFLPEGVSHATVAWVAASKAGFKVRAMDFTGAYWNDVGDPATYARAVLDALRAALQDPVGRRTGRDGGREFPRVVRGDPRRARRLGPTVLPRAERRLDGGAHGVSPGRS